MKILIGALVLCVSICNTQYCSAWGGQGHALVGKIAEQYLTEEAKAEVSILLNGQNLSSVASWADAVKRNPEYGYLGPTHYINLPRDATAIDLKRDGKEGENVVDAVIRSTAMLADREVSAKDRGDALKFLVHFVGDVHQPLHVSYADDRGGNDLKVQFSPNKHATKLHSAWDSKLMNRHPQAINLYNYILSTISEEQLAMWRKNADDPLAWANESFTYTQAVYQYLEENDNVVAQDEVDKYIEIVSLRLAAAGVRLAAVINKALESNVADSSISSEE